ncbi:DMT family transporter [Pectobacterium sp. B1J-3]|uniref:DMT family transporter n=1 Tax=Pectobacterium sp. B1J-3 TaxID=3385371 RepID=UPI00390642B3
MNSVSVLFLSIAIVMEVIATTALKASDSFTRLMPSIITCVGYAISFWCLSVTMRSMPTGIIYAIWSGVGIVLIGAVSWVVYGQKLDVPALIGMGMIIGGVVVVNLFSNTVGH